MSLLFFGMDILYDTEKVISPGLFVACPWVDDDGVQACFFMHTVALALRKYGFVTPESRYWFYQGYGPVQRELHNARNRIGLAPRLPIHASLVNALNSHMPPEYPTTTVMLGDVMKALEHYDILSRRTSRAARVMPPTPSPTPVLHPENEQLLPPGTAPVLQQPIANVAPMVSHNIAAMTNHFLENDQFLPTAAAPVLQQPNNNAGGMISYNINAIPNYVQENGHFTHAAAAPISQQPAANAGPVVRHHTGGISNHGYEIPIPMPQAPPAVLQQANQGGALGLSWDTAINIDDGEEIMQAVSAAARPAEIDLRTDAANAAVDKRRDSGTTIKDDSEIGPNQLVNNSPALPAANQDGAATSHPSPTSNSSDKLEIQHTEPVKNATTLPTAGHDDGAIARPPTSPSEDPAPENSRKRKRPTVYTAPPRSYDPNTQVMKAIGASKFKKFERWMPSWNSMVSTPEPGQGPSKKRRKSPGPSNDERNAVALAENDYGSPAPNDNQQEVEDDNTSLEDNLQAAFDAQNEEEAKDTSLEDGIQAAFGNQTTSDHNEPNVEDASQAARDEQAEYDWLEAEFFESDEASLDYDGELILEDPEEFARKYWENEDRRKEAEAREAAAFDEYLKLQWQADGQMEDEAENEVDEDEDEMSEEDEAGATPRDIDEELTWSEEE